MFVVVVLACAGVGVWSWWFVALVVVGRCQKSSRGGTVGLVLVVHCVGGASVADQSPLT